MKTVREIEKEYEKHVPKQTTITSLEEFLVNLEIGLDDLDEYTHDFKKELRENHEWKLIAQIRNFFFFIFEQEDVEFYDYDDAIVKDCITYTQQFSSFYQRMIEIATEENYQELNKLYDFSLNYYEEQTSYYDAKRDQVEMAFRGFSLYNGKYQNTREPFFEFMDQKIKEMEASFEQFHQKVKKEEEIWK